tara:strand:- start:613 stop:888 length:276 start_codon:yes stop_codon:yes gene_type:complete
MKKNKTLALIALLTTGCLTEKGGVEQHLLHVPDFHNAVEKETPGEEWDGTKGKFPAGRVLRSDRVIDYRGHGTGYSGHADHHHHNQYNNKN